jgi:hypothetical protein
MTNHTLSFEEAAAKRTQQEKQAALLKKMLAAHRKTVEEEAATRESLGLTDKHASNDDPTPFEQVCAQLEGERILALTIQEFQEKMEAWKKANGREGELRLEVLGLATVVPDDILEDDIPQ